MVLTILYEDDDILVVEKPVGVESQVSRGFEPDMISEIRRHINKLCTGQTQPYVGVIHRLDKPVGGVMVYAKTKRDAALLSKQVQNGRFEKTYYAVICGKPVDIVGNYVDYLRKDEKENLSYIVDQSEPGAKRAELKYRVLKTIDFEGRLLSCVKVQLLSGRHHQIRVQFAGHGTPLWGDYKYNHMDSFQPFAQGESVALCACRLSFIHPATRKKMSFSMKPGGEIFDLFPNETYL